MSIFGEEPKISKIMLYNDKRKQKKHQESFGENISNTPSPSRTWKKEIGSICGGSRQQTHNEK